MTAHVAEADEARGRVILRSSSWLPNDVAIQAAMLVANAFNSEVELLLVEDSQRVNFANFPFAKEFSLHGGQARAISAEAVRAEIDAAFKIARQRVAAACAEHEVPVYEHIVRDDPVQALASACARRGPWNMIAIAETFGTPMSFSLDEVFDGVDDATGIIIAGPEARAPAALGGKPQGGKVGRPIRRRSPSSGPVVLAVEDAVHIQGMLRVGRYLAAALKVEVVILIVAGTDEALARTEAEVRLLLADESAVRLARSDTIFGEQAAVADFIRRQNGSFLIAQYGGITAPRARSLRPLTGALPCPALLVR